MVPLVTGAKSYARPACPGNGSTSLKEACLPKAVAVVPRVHMVEELLHSNEIRPTHGRESLIQGHAELGWCLFGAIQWTQRQNASLARAP